VYVRNTIGRIPDADLVRRLEQATSGNPFFLRELVPLFSRSGTTGGPGERLAVPSSVAHLLRSQTERLSKPARDLVEVAAVVGRTFTARLLARVTGRGNATVINLLQEARGENLIDGDRPGSFRFRHDVVRAALLDELRTTRRIDLHRRVAKAIESGGETESHLPELAYHYFEATPQIGPEKCSRPLRWVPRDASEWITCAPKPSG
jgi:predicted ATPase